MNESKELEALHKIDNTICLNSCSIKFGVDEDAEDCYNIDDYADCYNTLEYAVMRKEILEEENAKYKKAIEICKNKQVDFSVLKLAKEVEDYNYECPFTEGLLTEEEFELLKEVFGI